MSQKSKILKQPVEAESAIYKVYELKKALSEALDNLKNYKKEQEALIDIIERSGRGNELNENFVSGLKEDLDETMKKVPMFEARLQAATLIIEVYEKNDDASKFAEQMITAAYMALGVMSNE